MLTVARTQSKPAPSSLIEPPRLLDPPAGTAAWIQEAQRCIVEALDLDGSTLFERCDDGDLRATHAWRRAEAAGFPSRLSVRESLPWMLETLLAGEVVCVSGCDELSVADRASLQRLGLESIVMVPLLLNRRVIGVAGFAAARHERLWRSDVLQRLCLASDVFGNAIARRHSDEALRGALADVARLTGQLRADSRYQRREAEGALDTSSVGRSAAIRLVLEQVRQVAETDATVLLLGETGSGKEVFASQIHALSRRGARPMVRVNCAAVPATLIESELFGREKGAYTGALSRQVGRFELADGSTIFLDEVGDVPADIQVKLLRALEERQIERLGSATATKIDTRIIAATHRNLEKLVEADTFREDLYDRLNVFPIRVPPLRERTEDVPVLVWRFVADFSAALGKRVESITKDNMELLQRYPWPGNVRELRNLVERAVICSDGPRLTIAVPSSSPAAARRSVKLFDVEKEHIKSVLDGTRWRIRGVGGAADRLGLKATTLEARMAKLGLQRPPH